MGDPLDRGTDVGPQARADLRDELHDQVEESVKRAPSACSAARIPRGAGAFYPPTMLAAVDAGMPAFDEETFGPVAAVIRAKDERDAVRLANDSTFGLGAALWTRDLDRARRLAAEIEAGCVFVNGMVKSDPRLPFGGIKRSGYGRELRSSASASSSTSSRCGWPDGGRSYPVRPSRSGGWLPEVGTGGKGICQGSAPHPALSPEGL